jgi:hypothetical protein
MCGEPGKDKRSKNEAYCEVSLHALKTAPVASNPKALSHRRVVFFSKRQPTTRQRVYAEIPLAPMASRFSATDPDLMPPRPPYRTL